MARIRRRGILATFFSGRRSPGHNKGHGYDNDDFAYIKHPPRNRRATRQTVLRRRTRAAQEDERPYSRKYRRGGWGRGFLFTKTGRVRRHNGQPVARRPKIRLSAEERKEEARIAARRRYLLKHPNAKRRAPRHRGPFGFL